MTAMIAAGSALTTIDCSDWSAMREGYRLTYGFLPRTSDRGYRWVRSDPPQPRKGFQVTAGPHTVTEFTPPQEAAPSAERNFADYIFDYAQNRPNHVSMRRRDPGGPWRDVTAKQFAEDVLELARGLLNAGIQPGDRIALMSRTRYEWTLVDFAVAAIGAVTVPVYETSSAEQVQWILSDSGAVAAIVETKAHAETVESVRGEAPGIRELWVIDDGGLEAVRGLGGSATADDVHERRTAVTPDDLASIIYTSGTTGRPKGCELTHGNFLFEVTQVRQYLGDLLNDQASTLLFLPIAHVFGRAIEIGCLATGCTLGHTPDVRNLIDDLAGFQPRFVAQRCRGSSRRSSTPPSRRRTRTATARSSTGPRRWPSTTRRPR